MIVDEISAGRRGNSLGFDRFSLPLRVALVLVITVLIYSDPISAGKNQHSCGRRQASTVFLIHRGVPSELGQWPWHAAIFLTNRNQTNYICGGSIIGKNTILSAAHCFFLSSRPILANQLTVHVGQVHLADIAENGDKGYEVSTLITHPVFRGVENDIAVLKLSTDLIMTSYVQPVCLGTRHGGVGEIVGKAGTVVGFGYNEHDRLPGKLHEASLTVVDALTCISSDRESYGLTLTDKMFCAGGTKGVSACNGDSGGGMYFESAGTWYLRGIVSFISKREGSMACDSSKYTIFTDVNKYIHWVQSIDKRWRLTHLEPCESGIGAVEQGAMCNVANRFDHSFLLVAQDWKIFRVQLKGGQRIPFFATPMAIGLDRDCAKGRFYWYNHSPSQIFSAKYDGTDRKPFITKHIGWPQGAAVDWISRRLYWADSRRKTIEVASLDRPSLRTVLVYQNLSHPVRVAVDPLHGRLYWLDLDEKAPKIEWSHLDGTERQILVESPRIVHPNSIQVSLATAELCYTDDGTGKIECINSHNKKIRTIASDLTEPIGLVVTDELFYWTDYSKNSIESINLNGARQTPITSLGCTFRYTHQMTAVTDTCPVFYSPCAVKNGECPKHTLCLVNPSVPEGKSCLVPKKCVYTDDCRALV